MVIFNGFIYLFIFNFIVILTNIINIFIVVLYETDNIPGVVWVWSLSNLSLASVIQHSNTVRFVLSILNLSSERLY